MAFVSACGVTRPPCGTPPMGRACSSGAGGVARVEDGWVPVAMVGRCARGGCGGLVGTGCTDGLWSTGVPWPLDLLWRCGVALSLLAGATAAASSPFSFGGLGGASVDRMRGGSANALSPRRCRSWPRAPARSPPRCTRPLGLRRTRRRYVTWSATGGERGLLRGRTPAACLLPAKRACGWRRRMSRGVRPPPAGIGCATSSRLWRGRGP